MDVRRVSGLRLLLEVGRDPLDDQVVGDRDQLLLVVALYLSGTARLNESELARWVIENDRDNLEVRLRVYVCQQLDQIVLGNQLYYVVAEHVPLLGRENSARELLA